MSPFVLGLGFEPIYILFIPICHDNGVVQHKLQRMFNFSMKTIKYKTYRSCISLRKERGSSDNFVHLSLYGIYLINH